MTRDPASYVQFATWISRHRSLPIPQDAAAFGGTHHVLTFASFAYYQVGNSVVPQFMAGLPMILAGGFWIGGVGAAVAMAPVLGACAVLTFGGLAARLVGPRWAPLAVLILAAIPAGGVHQSLDLQRAGRPDPVPRRALPDHRRLARRPGGPPR